MEKKKKHLFSIADREQTVKAVFLLGWQMFWHCHLKVVPILLLQPTSVMWLQERFWQDTNAKYKLLLSSSRAN